MERRLTQGNRRTGPLAPGTEDAAQALRDALLGPFGFATRVDAETLQELVLLARRV